MRSNINIRPLTPVKGTLEPLPGTVVHFLTPSLSALCRGPGSGFRPKTADPGRVTCSNCLRELNLPAHSQQPPCGSPAGATALSAEPALPCAKKPVTQQSSFGGSPASASCPDAGFL